MKQNQSLITKFLITKEEVGQRKDSAEMIQQPITQFFHKINQDVYRDNIIEEIKKTRVLPEVQKRKPGRPPKKPSKEIEMLINKKDQVTSSLDRVIFSKRKMMKRNLIMKILKKLRKKS